MKQTCLVTVQPAEGESVEIEFTCDRGWKQRLGTILDILDNRLAQMNRRLIADTTAQASLSPEQYTRLLDVVNTQFPSCDTDMPLCLEDARILIRKMTNNREQIALRYDCTHDDLINQILADAFDTLDERMIATNQRDLDAYALFNSYAPEDKQPLQMVLDCLYGRADAHQVGVRLASHALVEAKKEIEAAVQNGEEG